MRSLLKNWDLTTGLLHGLLALFVSLQIIFGFIIESYKPWGHFNWLRDNGFTFHQIFGIAVLVVIVLHWLWSIFNKHGVGFKHLFPWGPQGMKAIGKDIKNLCHFKLPPMGPRHGLAGFVHGLGFLTVTMMALTGLIMFLAFNNILSGSVIHPAKSTHVVFAWLLWFYWGGHVMLAMLHRLLKS